MQRTLVSCLLFCFVSSPGIARGAFGEPEIPQYKVFFGGNQDEPKLESKCPKTMIVGRMEDCLQCHVAGKTFAIKESAPDATREYPFRGMRIINDVLYFDIYEVNETTTASFRETSMYLTWHPEVKRVVLNIFSPGGELFQALNIRGTITNWKTQGIKVQTQVQGWAASASFMIFVSGSKGYRFVDRDAQLMWHEIQTFDWPGMSTVSDQSEKARVLEYLQHSANRYLAEQSNLTTEEINEKIKNREFWMTGQDAVSMGFADGLLNGPVESATTIQSATH